MHMHRLRIVVAFLCGAFLPVCQEEDDNGLAPVKDCRTDDECVEADPRYDACLWVCAANVRYCQPSCETDQDCRGRGLPDDYVFCDIPRPGDGFCNQYGYAYTPKVCKQEVPMSGEDEDGSGSGP